MMVFLKNIIVERETPDFFIGAEGESVNSYEMISTLLKSNQELNTRLEKLEAVINDK